MSVEGNSCSECGGALSQPEMIVGVTVCYECRVELERRRSQSQAITRFVLEPRMVNLHGPEAEELLAQAAAEESANEIDQKVLRRQIDALKQKYEELKMKMEEQEERKPVKLYRKLRVKK